MLIYRTMLAMPNLTSPRINLEFLARLLTANDSECCESKNERKISQVVKTRWRELAKNAFEASVRHKIKIQQTQKEALIKNSQETKSPYLNAAQNQLLSDLIALNSQSEEEFIVVDENRSQKWVQLSGHEDSFALAGPGTIWKKRTDDSAEVRAYELLSLEPISEMIPKFYRDVVYKGDSFIELEDLLYHCKNAAIMDIKMGTRTFLESEVINAKPRQDLYQKMIKINPHEPTEEEHQLGAITKLRYMQFRETLSSSSNLGFRIEGFKVGDDLKNTKNLHAIQSRDDVTKTFNRFFQSCPQSVTKIVDRLRKLRKFFENSEFFSRHEVIGSSLLLIYTENYAGVYMIDFAKTLPVPANCEPNHRRPWKFGNHEDGYLYGLDNLISVLDEIR